MKRLKIFLTAAALAAVIAIMAAAVLTPSGGSLKQEYAEDSEQGQLVEQMIASCDEYIAFHDADGETIQVRMDGVTYTRKTTSGGNTSYFIRMTDEN